MAGFHGRRNELGAIRAAIDRGRSVVITGDAGIGKSALWREAIARQPGRRVIRAVATGTSRSIPFGALAAYLPRSTGDPLGQLVDALAAFRQHDGDRSILAIDDAHLLDDSSAALVLQVAEQRLTTVVVTVRAGEPAPDAITALAKEDLADLLVLGPLDAASAAALVEDLVGGLVDPRTNSRLYEASGGHPLFLRELVLRGLDDRSLTDVGGVMSWVGEIQSGPTLSEVIDTRLSALEPDVRSCAEMVAISGPLPAAVLELVCSPIVVASALKVGILRTRVEPGRAIIETAHPLYGPALVAGTPTSRIRSVLESVVTAAEARGVRDRADEVRLASWLVALADRSHPSVLLAAAERAFDSTDIHLAARLADAAVEAGAGEVAQQLQRRIDMLLGRASTPLSDSTRPTADEAAIVQEAMTAADRFFFGFGSADDARASISGARHRLAAGRASDELAAMALIVDLNAGRRAGDVLCDVQALLGSTVDPAAVVRAALAGGPAAAVTGRSDLAVAWLEQAVGLAASVDSSRFIAHQVEATLAQAYVHAGRLDDAEHLVVTRRAAAIERDDRAARTGWAIAGGQVELWRGRPRTAARHFGEALALLGGLDLIGYATRCRADLAHALAWAGEPAAADDPPVPEPGEHGAFFAPMVRLALAERDVALGRLGAAHRRAMQAAEAALELEQPAIAALALHLAVRVRPAKLTAHRLRTVVQWDGDDLACVCVRSAGAIADDDAAALETTAAHWEAAGARALAVECFTRAAAAHRRGGVSIAARRCQAAALERAAQLEALPPLAETIQAGPRLTLREREVAGLAAQGFTNNEIAGRLGVSVRTVHTHLQVAYQKLGVNRRDLLAALLDTH